MKKMSRVLLGFILLGVSAASVFAMPPDDVKQFEKANELYKQSKFKEAVSVYEALADKYPSNSVLQFNLGNAYHRAGGKTGLSILAYERAVALNPRDGDARANLNYARGLLEYRVEDKRNWYLRVGERLLGYFTEKEGLVLALFFLFLLLSSSVFVFFFKSELSFGFLRKTGLVLFLLSLALVTIKHVQGQFLMGAIITVPEAPVRYGPSGSDQIAFRLKEGLKVYVADRGDDWSRVILTNGDTGWIEKAHIAEIDS